MDKGTIHKSSYLRQKCDVPKCRNDNVVKLGVAPCQNDLLDSWTLCRKCVEERNK